MPDQVVEKISSLLNEEKWTRATLNNYTIKNFEELDSLFLEVKSKGAHKEIKDLCDQHLEHSKNSIIALYLSGIISLSQQLVDDTHLIQLISIFSDNHKWGIVEVLCKRILDFGENKYALRTLAECYDNENRDEDKYAIWERLIKIDYNESDIVKKLAVHKEEIGKQDEAIIYYKKALHRFISKKMFTQVREIWQKLIEYNSEDTEFYFLIEKKIARNINPEKSIVLLKDIYPYLEQKEDWDICLDLLKTILEYEAANYWAREEIIKCYKKKYEGHSHLEEYIRLANLNQNWRNAIEAISDFEKHISFDKGNFVYHKTWNVGIIREIDNGEITIDFSTKRNHTMSLKMAINALMSLDKNHIWVLKSIKSKEALKKKIKSDHKWALRTIIKSFDNKADMKKIKAELVPSLFTPSEWTSWSNEARKILKTDPDFGNLPDKLDTFVVRDKPISFEEKTFNKFKAEKSFFNKIQTIIELLDNSDPDSDYFLEMFQYFTSFLKSPNTNVQVVVSYLFINKLAKTYPFLNPGINFTFEQLFSDIDDVEQLFSEIEIVDFKKDFLLDVKKNIEEWPEIFIQLFPYYLNRFILDDLVSNGYSDLVINKLADIIDHYRDNREVFFWIAKNAEDISVFNQVDIKYEKILINLVHLLELTFRDIGNKKDVLLNRRINKNVQNFLFKEDRLQNFILQQPQDSIERIFSLLQDVSELDPVIIHRLTQTLEENNITGLQVKKSTTGPELVAPSRFFYTLKESYIKKQKELKHILDVEIPKNSKEIGEAIEMGDLKENAEYKAGKEKQEALNIAVGKIKEELERARVIDNTDFDTKKVAFGNIVSLKNHDSGKQEVYTLLGPWESDPSNNVLSYLSPFGAQLMTHSVNDELKFVINEREYNYVIEKIEKYNV